MKLRKDIDYQAECQRLRRQIEEMHTRFLYQQKIVDRLLTYIEKQSGGKYISGTMFSRDHVNMDNFAIDESGKVYYTNGDFTFGG